MCVPLVLKKRRRAAQSDGDPSPNSVANVIPFHRQLRDRDPLDRLIIFLAKKAALEDHLAMSEEN